MGRTLENMSLHLGSSQILDGMTWPLPTSSPPSTTRQNQPLPDSDRHPPSGSVQPAGSRFSSYPAGFWDWWHSGVMSEKRE